MIRLLTLALLCCLSVQGLMAQRTSYTDSLKQFRANYIETHEVVKPAERSYFRFFPVNKTYAVVCRFERLNDTVGITMKTVAKKEKRYYRYGLLHFTLNKKPLQLTVYQSPDLLKVQEYADYLFIPFTDVNTGGATYGSGRYIDIRLGDIQNNTVLVDFNKAYNPYCAYATGFNCPIPPKENNLPAAINAGEKNWGKHH